MKKILIFVLAGIRIFILFKISYLLYKTRVDTINYPIDCLTWWIYFLVFDIWVSQILNTPPQVEEND